MRPLSFHFVPFHFISSPFISFRPLSFHIVAFHFISSALSSFRPPFISFRTLSFHLILFQKSLRFLTEMFHKSFTSFKTLCVQSGSLVETQANKEGYYQLALRTIKKQTYSFLGTIYQFPYNQFKPGQAQFRRRSCIESNL